MHVKRIAALLQRAPRWLDYIWLVVLAAYILAGTSLAPFHGDESTQIYMSRDYAYQFIQRDLKLVTYHQPPISAQEQHLRLLNGTLPKYLIGLGWHISGFNIDDLNQQWDWGADWDYNQQNGHAPSPALLLAGRWQSVLLLALGLLPLFAIGGRLGGRPAAYITTLYYALHPALLLNGRRAMMEGALICFSLCVLWAGIAIMIETVRAQGLAPHKRQPYRTLITWILLGLFSGLALASKHSALFTVAAVYGVIGIFAVIELARVGLKPSPTKTNHQWRLVDGVGLLISILTSAIVFYALNPAWWGDPINRVGEVLAMRGDLLSIQVQIFGGYANFGDQLAGFWRQALVALPQYYEVAGWENFIGDQIAAYEISLWRGVSVGGSVVGGLVLLALVGVGLWTLARKRDIPAAIRWLVAAWAGTMVLTTLLLTPLEWQRYYLPVYPALGLLAGVGISTLLRGNDGRTDAESRSRF